jgi:hypothetical protein
VSNWISDVAVHFTAMGVFSDTQVVPIDHPLVMEAPTRAACAA